MTNTQYWLGWIAFWSVMLVLFFAGMRRFVVNPLVLEARALRAEINALRR